MKLKIPVIIKDPEVARVKGVKLCEMVSFEVDDVFLDGPVCSRVAVLDFDPETGELSPTVRVKLPKSPSSVATYQTPQSKELNTDSPNNLLAQVSVFGSVLGTIQMFEEPDALGRKVTWAFNSPQLLVVPRAGEMANAYYERESHSLQFFFVRTEGRQAPVYACRSRDIIAHETAHAILDGVAPDLYHATTPQSLAIHEAVADLTAVLSAVRCRPLVKRVLRLTHGLISDSSAFSRIAPQFGAAIDGGQRPLRELLNSKTLGSHGRHAVDRAEPHELSEVLSGALYTVLVRLHQELRSEYAAGPDVDRKLAVPDEALRMARQYELDGAPHSSRERTNMSASIKALFVAAQRFKRTIYRALDYLPPGEVSFADYGRAILAADQASHPDSGAQRKWLRKEFLRRKIVAKGSELNVKTNFASRAVAKINLEELRDSDWVAYRFANDNRRLLRIPKDIPFQIRPRLDVTKEYYHRDKTVGTRECIFKVSWAKSEANRIPGNFSPLRQVMVGTTMAIDWETKKVRVLLTSDQSQQQRVDRDRFLTRLVESRLIKMGDEAIGPDCQQLQSAVLAEQVGGLFRVRGTSRMLHIIAEDMRG
jgi:hypothetical protein